MHTSVTIQTMMMASCLNFLNTWHITNESFYNIRIYLNKNRWFIFFDDYSQLHHAKCPKSRCQINAFQVHLHAGASYETLAVGLAVRAAGYASGAVIGGILHDVIHQKPEIPG